MDAHKKEVDRIAIRVQELYNTKQKFRIYHSSSNSTRPTVGKSSNTVDTSCLNNILRIDKINMIAVVEANVAMDTLLEETLKHDLMPLVVTEFPGITVGGAFSGTAGESSSFRHGLFDRTVSDVEIILANGEVLTCSATENADLFRGAPGALGTLGIVTLLHVRLQKAARYVEVTYHPVKNAKEAIEKLRTFATQERDELQYLDGMMFLPTKGAVITGRFTHANPLGLKVQRLIRSKDPWYFMHVESCLVPDFANAYTELIPLPDYVFRYHRGTFWCGKKMFELFGIKFSATTRRLFDRLLTARMSYKRLQMQKITTVIVQDVALPFPSAEELIKWSGEQLDFWPLWLCPLRVDTMSTLQPHPLKSNSRDDGSGDLMLNLGLYDVSARYYEDWIKLNRDLEDKVTELGGMKWASAHQMYPEDKFWQQHDREWYDNLREKCHATFLPTIYEKTKVDVEVGRQVLADRILKREKSWVRRNFEGVFDGIAAVNTVWKSVKSRAWRLERSSAWKNSAET